jgi:hypothetical protein
VQAATLRRQSYGIAMSQCTFGGPTGIWLECTGCEESQRIVPPKGDDPKEWIRAPDGDIAKVFRRHGWSGLGDRMTHARCPNCPRWTMHEGRKCAA